MSTFHALPHLEVTGDEIHLLHHHWSLPVVLPKSGSCRVAQQGTNIEKFGETILDNLTAIVFNPSPAVFLL